MFYKFKDHRCFSLFQLRLFLYYNNDPNVKYLYRLADVGLGTRGGSLTSSRGYLEVVGNGPCPGTGNYVQNANHASPLCSKCTDQSLLSFCSNVGIPQEIVKKKDLNGFRIFLCN